MAGTRRLMTYSVPGDLLEWPAGVVHSGETRIPNLPRHPAKDKNGHGLAFTLNEIDYFVLDALENFRPPTLADGSSPKTIYDYVEQKVASNPSIDEWKRFAEV